METPPSSVGAPSEPPSSYESIPERGDREVLHFLADALLPTLGDRTHRTVREAVRHAIREQSLAPLERLSGRHRLELLLAIEHIAETRRRPPPAVLVRLTTVISATPVAPDLVGVSAARPAR